MPIPRPIRPCRRLLGILIVVTASVTGAAGTASADVVAAGEAVGPGLTRVVLTVDEGCASAPTIGLRVQLPAGTVDAEAERPAGWSVEREGDELIWRGGPLPPEQRATFVATMRLPGVVGDVTHLPTVQVCTSGSRGWTDPAAGPGGAGATPRVELAVSFLPGVPVPDRRGTVGPGADRGPVEPAPGHTENRAAEPATAPSETSSDDPEAIVWLVLGASLLATATAVLAATLAARRHGGGPS